MILNSDNQAVMNSNLIIFIYLIKIKYKIIWTYTGLNSKNFYLKEYIRK